MIRMDFTDVQIEALKYERYNHPHPRVQRKMEALLLKSQGLPHKQICLITGITANTFRQYLRDYIEGGIDKLKEINFRRPKSILHEHKQTIEDYFRQHPPATVKEAIAKIHELTGIRRGPTQTLKFLKSIGMRRLKVGTVPAKADLDKQQAFKKKSWNLV